MPNQKDSEKAREERSTHGASEKAALLPTL